MRSMLGPVIPDALGHILIASVISDAGGARRGGLMVPFRRRCEGRPQIGIDDPPASFMEAITRGTSDGIFILANIIAMLIVHDRAGESGQYGAGPVAALGGAPFTLQRIFAWLPAAHVADRHPRERDRRRRRD